MHFDSTISIGNILTGISFLIAALIFIYSMKPRIEALEKENRESKKWRDMHESIARERDRAIQSLTIEVTRIVAMQRNAEERMERMDRMFEKIVTGMADRGGMGDR